jgi:crossover junction endodeoxyribonuclease RuvC
MFERLVVGVDPGTAATGVAAVSAGRVGAPATGPSVLWAETVRTSARSPEPERLRTLYRAIRDLLEERRPEAVAVESLMWGRNAPSAMAVARASGVVLLAAAELGIEVREYSPSEVKLSVTGNGAASKQEVRRALERLHAVLGVPREPDAADAVAIALCHLHQSRALREAAVGPTGRGARGGSSPRAGDRGDAPASGPPATGSRARQ